jgi:hypothetical protein
MRRDTARRIAAVALLSALSFTLVACPSSRDQDTVENENENENESPENEKVNKAENPKEEESENEKPENEKSNEKNNSGNAEP